MTTSNFPTSLDSFTAVAGTDKRNASPSLSTRLTKLADAVAALEAKVGVDSSAVTSSLDYKVANGGATGLEIANGCSTMPRPLAASNTGTFSGGFELYTGFVPLRSFTAANISVATTGTSTSPTHAWLGIYSVAANGDLTRIAITADTTALGTNGARKVPLVTPVALTGGSAYAVAALFVGATMGLACNGSLPVTTITAMNMPFLSGYNTGGGSTALPATRLFSALTMYTKPVYAEITV